jgi:hypothetical protein
MAFSNHQNLTEFIKLYSPDVEIYTYPDVLLSTGTDNMISIFKPKFIAKSIKVEIVDQMYNGNYVINSEIVFPPICTSYYKSYL